MEFEAPVRINSLGLLVGHPIPHYPLCSEYVLDENYRPRRVDTPFENAMCNLQTTLANRSTVFTFFSLRVSQSPPRLVFLYQLGSPNGEAERRPRRASADASAAAPALFPRTELTAAILHTLVRELKHGGAELMWLVVPSFWPALDRQDFVSEGVTTCEIMADLERPEFHNQHDSHLSPQGHRAVSRSLVPAVAERIRADRARAHVRRTG